MLNNLLECIKYTDLQKMLLTIGAFLGSSFSLLVGGVDNAMKWLIILVIIDYITGMIGAFKSGLWSSNNGFKGIFKKFLMFLVIAVCVGLDQILKCDNFRTISIFAYAVNEAGSIIENIDRMGFSGIIPTYLKKGLIQLRKEDSKKCE